MSIQRSQARPLPEPVLENTVVAGETLIDGVHPASSTRNRTAPTGSVRSAPTTDRGKFDILFACGVSAAFWAAVIFLLTVLL